LPFTDFYFHPDTQKYKKTFTTSHFEVQTTSFFG